MRGERGRKERREKGKETKKKCGAQSCSHMISCFFFLLHDCKAFQCCNLWSLFPLASHFLLQSASVRVLSHFSDTIFVYVTNGLLIAKHSLSYFPFQQNSIQRKIALMLNCFLFCFSHCLFPFLCV